MAFSHGKSARVYADGYKLSDFLSSVEAPMEAETYETTVFGSSGYKSYVPGNIDATLSGEGFYDGSTSGTDAVFTAALGSSYVIWNWYPEGDAAGNYGVGMKTIETAYNISSPVDGVISATIEGQSVVGRDRVQSIMALAAKTTTNSSGTPVSTTAGTTKGGIGYFQRTDNSTKGVTPTLQHSSGVASSSQVATWTTLVSFSSGTSKGAQRVAVSGAVKKQVRGKYTITGSTLVSTNLHFAFQRNV